jgi:two-component system sensor histidine kinase/response regulator
MEGPLVPAAEPLNRPHADAFRLELKKRSDRLMNYFLCGFFLLGLGFAFFYGTWSIAFGVGGISLLAYYITKIALPDSDLYQYVLSVVLAIFMAQYIYQMHGLFEMHFFAFIGSAILITYQNWKLQIPMLVLVLIHHATLGYLQDIGFDKVYFTQLSSFELQAYVIHILLAAIIFFTCGLWAYQLNKYSAINIGQSHEMGRLQMETLLAVNEQKHQLERHADVLDKAVAQGKFEIASDTMHDIGNAVVGFGSYLTRIRRLQENDNPENLHNLAGFFATQKTPIAAAIGEAKAGAVVEMLSGIARTQKSVREEINRSVEEQLLIIANIHEILDIQRQYISGHESQERKPVNLRNIINDALAMLFSVIEKKDIDVSLDVPDGLPLIKGDRTKLIQVILNILKNSIEDIGIQEGKRAIYIRVHAPADWLVLEIRDNGKGFDGSMDGGLYRAIIDSHAGSMDITSEGPGRGSLTTIRLKIQTE